MSFRKRLFIFVLALLIVQTIGWSVDRSARERLEELNNEADMWRGIESRLRHPPMPSCEKPPTKLVIRRLHLMRPDLIPYPLDLHYYC